MQIKGAAVHTPPLNTSGVLARGCAHDVLRFVEQASCFALQRRGGITKMEQSRLNVSCPLLRGCGTFKRVQSLMNQFEGLDYVLNWLCYDK